MSHLPATRLGPRWLAPTVLIALSAACEVPSAPPFPGATPPIAFSVSVWGWPWGSHDVTLQGDTLLSALKGDYSFPSATSRVAPTLADWGAFWRAADQAGLRSWPRECQDPDIVDGGGFSLDISYDQGRVQASGVNSYPRRDGHCNDGGERTAEYQAFLDAVGRLIGQSYPGR